MNRRPLPGRFELNHQVRTFEIARRVVKQATKDRRGEPERYVPEGAPRLRWGRGSHDVAVQDLHVRLTCEPTPETIDEHGIELHGCHAGCALGKWLRQSTGASSDLHHMVGRPHTGIPDELGCDQPAPQEVLAVRLGTTGPR